MTTAKKIPILLATFIFLIVFPVEASAYLKVMTVPGHPVTLVFQHDNGQVVSAFLRTPEGIHPVKSVEGFILGKSAYLLPYADGDLLKDLIWKIEFRDQKKEKNMLFWITALTKNPRAWVAMTPVSPTLWEKLPFDVKTPGEVFLYVSPNLPGYGENKPRGGDDVLSFVYAIGLTKDGPNFVLAPDVYKQLLLVTDLVRKAEQEEDLKNAYDAMHQDFERMANLQMPSREAIQNFSWKKIMSLSWRP